MNVTEDRIIIEAENPGDLEAQLERSVGALIGTARDRGEGGIVVIRHSPNHYIVQLDAQAEYGTITERCEWRT